MNFSLLQKAAIAGIAGLLVFILGLSAGLRTAPTPNPDTFCAPHVEKALAEANAASVARAHVAAAEAFEKGAETVRRYETAMRALEVEAYEKIYSSGGDGADRRIDAELCDAMRDAHAAVSALRAAADCGVQGAD